MIYKASHKGFTLIEIMVATTVTALLLPTLFTIVFSLLRQQYQIEQLQRLKEVGDYISNVMINQVRTNATIIDNRNCANETEMPLLEGDNYLFFRDRGNYCFGFYLHNNQLSQVSQTGSALQNAVLLDNKEADFPVQIERLTMTVLNQRLAKIDLTLKLEASNAYYKPQSLSYHYYTYIRR